MAKLSTRLENAGLVLSLGNALKASGSWTGETHVQKTGYFLKELLRVPVGFEYILYKHGPFSFELRDLLTYMQAEDFIQWTPQPPYGPTLRPGSFSGELLAQFGGEADRYARQINFTAEKLGKKTVAELERLATALYVESEEHRIGSDRVSRIIELKPHISTDQAQAAVGELEKIRTSARDQQLLAS